MSMYLMQRYKEAVVRGLDARGGSDKWDSMGG